MAAFADRRRVLALAEQGEWDDVLALVATDQALAQAQDDFGMLPLHWACTEPCVPLDVLRALLTAFPGACELENLSGMAPLHVAIASKLTGLAISALLEIRPAVAFMRDSTGRYPVELALDNNLPKFTIDLIRKAGARAVRSNSAAALRARSASTTDFEPTVGDDDASRAELVKARSVGSLLASRQAAEYARLLAKTPMVGAESPIGPIESTEIALHLKELLAQLQQLSVDLRTSSSASGSTYRSSFSSSSSSSHRSSRSAASPTATTVLWNPSDKLGLDLEPVTSDTGARIKKVATRSSVLGVEALSVGDVLVSINGTAVLESSFATITRFLKHSKAACKLRFSKSGGPGASGGRAGVRPMPRHVRSDSSDSLFSSARGFTPMSHLSSRSDKDDPTTNQLQLPETTQPDTAMLYAKVAELLDTTLKKVSAVEETVRLSSAMAFCT